MLHAYYSVLRVVLSSLDLFALTFLSLPTLKQTCEPHTRSLLLTLWRTHTRIKTKWNWETCQHFRLCFYVCLSFLVISTHLNDNNNNISKVCGKGEKEIAENERSGTQFVFAQLFAHAWPWQRLINISTHSKHRRVDFLNLQYCVNCFGIPSERWDLCWTIIAGTSQ